MKGLSASGSQQAEASLQALEPVGMARFFQQTESGQGDYAKEKYEMPEPSWEEIEAALKNV